MPAELARLPRSTELALYAPTLRVVLTELRRLESLVPRAPELDPLSRALFSGEALEELGIAPDRAAVLVPFDEQRFAFQLGLASRPRFEQWIAEHARGALTDAALQGEHVHVVDAGGEHPLACLARHNELYCQVGPADPADPLAVLRAVLPSGPPTLGQVGGLAQAALRLPPGPVLVALAQPEAAAKRIGQWVARSIARAHLFSGALARKNAELQAQLVQRRLRAAAEGVDGIAAAWLVGEDGWRVETELALNELGDRTAHGLRPSAEPEPALLAWSDTPALARLLLHLRPEHAARLLAHLGLEAPAGALSGTLAYLALGVDAECATARRRGDTAEGWAFILPSALAVGLAPKAPSPVLEDSVRRMFERQGVDPLPRESSAEGAIAEGRRDGSPLEARRRDDILFIGTGPGSAAAAERRLGASPGRGRRPAWMEGSVDLRAVDAALEAAELGPEAREGLREIERWRSRARPLLHQLDSVNLSVELEERRARLRLELSR